MYVDQHNRAAQQQQQKIKQAEEEEKYDFSPRYYSRFNGLKLGKKKLDFDMWPISFVTKFFSFFCQIIMYSYFFILYNLICRDFHRVLDLNHKKRLLLTQSTILDSGMNLLTRSNQILACLFLYNTMVLA
ncbi:hypothetical protein ACJX0J_009649 [Zea mays]